MKVKQPNRNLAGFSLLELVVTTAMAAVLVTSVSVLLRSTQAAWEGFDSDQARIEAAHAAVRHLTRQLRQAEQVTAISGPADTVGTVTVIMADGSTVVWARLGNDVNFGVGAATDLLASDIAGLTFEGFQADGVTATVVPSEIQAVKCTVTVNLDVDTGGTRSLTAWIWMRAW